MFANISVVGLEVRYGGLVWFTRCHFLLQQTSHNACSRYVISTCHLMLAHRQDIYTCEYILNNRSLSMSLWVLWLAVTTHRSWNWLPTALSYWGCACMYRVLLACPNCRLWCLCVETAELICHLTWSTALYLTCPPCIEMLSNWDSAVGIAAWLWAGWLE
jgi:hypothetical protein